MTYLRNASLHRIHLDAIAAIETILTLIEEKNLSLPEQHVVFRVVRADVEGKLQGENSPIKEEVIKKILELLDVVIEETTL